MNKLGKRFPPVSKETQKFFHAMKHLTGRRNTSHRHIIWMFFHNVGKDKNPYYGVKDLLKGYRCYLARQIYIRTDKTTVYLEKNNGIGVEPTIKRTFNIDVLKEIDDILEKEQFQKRMAEL